MRVGLFRMLGVLVFCWCSQGSEGSWGLEVLGAGALVFQRVMVLCDLRVVRALQGTTNLQTIFPP